MFYVYKITNTVNNKVYIGKSNNPSKRWRKHIKIAAIGSKDKSFSIIHAAIQKYGIDSFSISILEELVDETSALEREVYWVALHKSNIRRYGDDFGYNLTDGGEGVSGYTHTESAKLKCATYKKTHPNTVASNRKISQANKNITFTQSHRDKLSDAGRGEHNTNAKLDASKVSIIKELLRNGTSQIEIAKQFGISEGTVHYIKIGKRWAHIK